MPELERMEEELERIREERRQPMNFREIIEHSHWHEQEL